MYATTPRSILITGASSGIGAALAVEYAADGITLYLSGRSAERTEAIAQRCIEKGAKAFGKVIDVADRRAMADWIATCDDQVPLDLVIANAGISSGTSSESAQKDKVRDIFSINLAGVLNTAEPALSRMKERKRGQIGLVSSIAAFRGLPSSPAYCASKAAVKHWGEAMRGAVLEDGVHISVICPGFVRSRITDQNEFKMPFFMEADNAARLIRKGLLKDKALIAFPWQMFLSMKLLTLLPTAWADRLLAKAPRKE